MCKMKKLVSAVLMLGLLLTLMAPAVLADAATPAISTDYTKYPNTLSLDLQSSPGPFDPMNGQVQKNDDKKLDYLYFKVTEPYYSVMKPLQSVDASEWLETLVPGLEMFYNGVTVWGSTSSYDFSDGIQENHLPIYYLSDGTAIAQYYDGNLFYLAKDKKNVLIISSLFPNQGLPQIDFYAKYNTYRENPKSFDRPEAASILALCRSFETAIAAKNAAATPVTTPVTTPAVTAAPGLVAHYKFEGNLTDSSGKGHHGSEVGSLVYASGGASGQALKLDGSGYVKIPGADSLNLGDRFTLNAWVKLAAAENDVNRYNTILFKEHPTEPGYFIYKAVASGTHDVRLDIQQLSTGFEPVVGTDGVGSLDLASKWTMATWVSDGDTLYVYVDGKLQATATTGKQEYGTPFSDTIASSLFIGGPKGASAELFNGQIDEVKLFSRALSGAEIKAEYDAVKSGGSHVLQLWIDQYRIVKDNQESPIDSAPVILNGRTMVPVRPVIEAMGGTVAYDPATRKIDLAFKGRSLTLWIDRYEAVVNGQTVTLEVAPTVLGGRTMLPLRFAAESLGAGVEWDKATQRITLTYQ